jgi:hypothetical protein
VLYVVSTELDRLAIEAEADRLASIFEQVRLLAQAQRLSFIQAVRDTVAKGLITASDGLWCARPWANRCPRLMPAIEASAS